jgi:hypothetical protein
MHRRKLVKDLDKGDIFWFSGNWRIVVSNIENEVAYHKAFKKSAVEKFAPNSLIIVDVNNSLSKDDVNFKDRYKHDGIL